MNSIISFKELYHYGVKGQKWGVRRYQNKDGSLTPLGKNWYGYLKNEKLLEKTSDSVRNIIDTMSKDERRKLLNDPDASYYPENIVKRIIEYSGNMPVAFLDIERYYANDGQYAGNVVIGTDSNYRRSGHATKMVNKAKKWMETERAQEILNMNRLEWLAYRDNQPSIDLAKKQGFEDDPDYRYDLEEWRGVYHPSKRK